MYSVYSPLSVSQASSRSNCVIAKGLGLKVAKSIDSNCVLSIYSEMKKVVERMRLGSGPAYLEFKTYRWREHCGPNFDNHIGYREENEFLEWQRRDPLRKVRLKLEGHYRDFLAYEIELVEEINKEINIAFEFADKSPFPRKEDIQQNIFGAGSLGSFT